MGLKTIFSYPRILTEAPGFFTSLQETRWREVFVNVLLYLQLTVSQVSLPKIYRFLLCAWRRDTPRKEQQLMG